MNDRGFILCRVGDFYLPSHCAYNDVGVHVASYPVRADGDRGQAWNSLIIVSHC